MPSQGLRVVALRKKVFPTIPGPVVVNAPSLVVIDDFLTSPALLELRRFCEEATVWKSQYGNGYVGTFLSEGFCPRGAAGGGGRIEAGHAERLGDHALIQAWAFQVRSEDAGKSTFMLISPRSM